MVVIRLNRLGSKKRPKYRITVADSRSWLGGKFREMQLQSTVRDSLSAG